MLGCSVVGLPITVALDEVIKMFASGQKFIFGHESKILISKFGQAQPMATRCVKTGSSPIWRTKGFTGVGLRPSKKYWRSAGERRTKSSISTKLSRYFFNETKLTKKVELKSNGDEKCNNLQLIVKPRMTPNACLQ